MASFLAINISAHFCLFFIMLYEILYTQWYEEKQTERENNWCSLHSMYLLILPALPWNIYIYTRNAHIKKEKLVVINNEFVLAAIFVNVVYHMKCSV